MNFGKSLKKNKIKILYIFILSIFFIVFLVLAFLNVEIKKQIANVNVLINPIVFTPSEYPEIKNKFLEPQISAVSAVVVDQDSGVILYKKNHELRFPPASTTKIMTALVALDHYAEEDVLKIYKANVEGSSISFKQNEKFYFKDLLYAMMLPSSNDATLAIAQNYPGGEKEFVRKMNEKAREYNLHNSYFEEPVGLNDEKDYSTAFDLSRLANIAMRSKEFREIVKTKNIKISSIDGNQYSLQNLNILLNLPGVNGVKTGFTEGAGQVLVTSRKADDGREVIIVVMQSEDRFADSELLLNYINSNLVYLPNPQ